MDSEINEKRNELINYLQDYLSKKFNMFQVFKSIKKSLIRNTLISEKQFISIIKFLEREKRFKRYTKQEIREYFDCLIGNKNSPIHFNTLDEFF